MRTRTTTTIAMGPMNYKQLFSDPANNPLGTESEAKAGYEGIFANWRSTARPITGEALLAETVLDLSTPVGSHHHLG